MFFTTRKIEEVDEFLIIYFTRATIMNDYLIDCNEFRNEFRDIMDGQSEHDLYKRSFSSDGKFYD